MIERKCKEGQANAGVNVWYVLHHIHIHSGGTFKCLSLVMKYPMKGRYESQFPSVSLPILIYPLCSFVSLNVRFIYFVQNIMWSGFYLKQQKVQRYVTGWTNSQIKSEMNGKTAISRNAVGPSISSDIGEANQWRGKCTTVTLGFTPIRMARATVHPYYSITAYCTNFNT